MIMQSISLMRVSSVLLLMFVLALQPLRAADEIQWMPLTLTSHDGSVVIRLNVTLDMNNFRVIGFFQPDGKARRIVRAQHSIEAYEISRDGYFGAVGEERRDNGISGKTLYLYCPFGHLVWKTDLGKMAYFPNFSIAENGNAVAVYLPQSTTDPFSAMVLKIFDADGKEVRSMAPPASIERMNFLDNATLLEASANMISAVDITTGALLWKNVTEGFDFGRGQFMVLSPDKSVFLVIDFHRTKTDADVLLTPRMRIFKTATGELLVKKTFVSRSQEKVQADYHIRYDTERHQFSVEEIPDMVIQY